MTKVEKGNKIKVEYTGKLEDGSVFDSSKNHGKPLEFEVGSGQVIKGFDEGVLDMKVGDKKTLTLKPEEAYGPRRDELVSKVPKDKLPPGDVKEGMMLTVTSPEGHQFPATIVKVEEKEVTIDMNPPLAGKILIFDLELVEIN